MMKKVYICAPLGGDVEGNLCNAKKFAKYALLCGTAPVVSHFYAECPMTVFRVNEKLEWRPD